MLATITTATAIVATHRLAEAVSTAQLRYIRNTHGSRYRRPYPLSSVCLPIFHRRDADCKRPSRQAGSMGPPLHVLCIAVRCMYRRSLLLDRHRLSLHMCHLSACIFLCIYTCMHRRSRPAPDAITTCQLDIAVVVGQWTSA